MRQSLVRLAEDIGLAFNTVQQARRVAARWPKERRQTEVSFTIRYDPGKKINGRKRHLVVDTRGLPLLVMVTPADLHDSAGAAKELLFRLRLMHPEITIVRADSAYAGKLVTWAKRRLNLTVETVSRPRDASGFVILPRRWIVERSLAWMMHARRHARDYERLVQHSETLITWAAITLMTRRLTRTGPRIPWTKRRSGAGRLPNPRSETRRPGAMACPTDRLREAAGNCARRGRGSRAALASRPDCRITRWNG